jgi:hypothetical protein
LIDSLVFGNNKQHRLVQTLILFERRGDRIKTKETGFLPLLSVVTHILQQFQLMSALVARYNGTPFNGWGMPTNKKLSDSETSLLFWGCLLLNILS